MQKILDTIKISLIIFIVLGIVFIIIQAAFLNQEPASYAHSYTYNGQVNNAAKALKKLHKKRAKDAELVNMYTDFSEFKAQSGTIKYFSRTEYDRSIDYSFSLWNSIIKSVSFQRTLDKNQAQLILLSNSKLLDQVCSDEDTIVSTCLGAITNNNASKDNPGIIILKKSSTTETRALMLKTIAHEIGHYLGLVHNEKKKDKCSIMKQGVPCIKKGKVFANFTINDFEAASDLYRNVNKNHFLTARIELGLEAFEALEKS